MWGWWHKLTKPEWPAHLGSSMCTNSCENDSDKRRAADEALVEKLASEAETKLLIGRMDLLARYEAEHEDDWRSFACEFRRWGDHLSLLLRRDKAYQATYAGAVMLNKESTIQICFGHPPDLKGVYRYRAEGSSSTAVVVTGHDENWNPFSSSVKKLFVPTVKSGGNHHGYSTHGYTLPTPKLVTYNMPRPAQDDVLNFDAGTMYVPAGLGQRVYDAILQAIASDLTTGLK